MSEYDPNKKQRTMDSSPGEQNFQDILYRTSKIAEEVPDYSNALTQFKQETALLQVKQKTKRLETIQALVAAQLLKQEEKERKLQSLIAERKNVQNSSRLSWLDRSIQLLLLNFLDEEALWALEESTVLDLGDLKEQESRWESLRGRRLQAYNPKHWWKKPLSSREKCIVFGKTSRFARGMEVAAQQHYYGEDGREETGKKLQWPDQFFTIQQSEESALYEGFDGKFFVRMSLKEDNGSHVILEGFSSNHPKSVKIFYSDMHIWRARLYFNEFSGNSKIIEATKRYYEGKQDDDGNLDEAEKFCNCLTVTVIFEKDYGNDLQLVVSSSGFDGADDWDNFRLGLTPRSLSPGKKDFDGTNSVRACVGWNARKGFFVEVESGKCRPMEPMKL